MEEPKAKFPFASKVIINKNVAGIVLYSYNMYMATRPPFFIYRIIVNSEDLCYRVSHNYIDQTNRTDLFSEDFDNLISSTKNIQVMEIGEDKLELFEGEVTPFGEPY